MFFPDDFQVRKMQGDLFAQGLAYHRPQRVQEPVGLVPQMRRHDLAVLFRQRKNTLQIVFKALVVMQVREAERYAQRPFKLRLIREETGDLVLLAVHFLIFVMHKPLHDRIVSGQRPEIHVHLLFSHAREEFRHAQPVDVDLRRIPPALLGIHDIAGHQGRERISAVAADDGGDALAYQAFLQRIGQKRQVRVGMVERVDEPRSDIEPRGVNHLFRLRVGRVPDARDNAARNADISPEFPLHAAAVDHCPVFDENIVHIRLLYYRTGETENGKKDGLFGMRDNINHAVHIAFYGEIKPP